MLSIALATAPLTMAIAGPAEDRATARELFREGVAAADKGDCATAIDRLERAESLFHAPPHLQHLGRCYAKLGRLVDAAEAWRKLTYETLPPNAPAVFRDAVAEAQTELPKIEPRLARLTIRASESYPNLTIDVDGKPWPNAALDVPRVIDPGSHVIKARANGYKPQETTVELAEGGSQSVTLKLEAGDPSLVGTATPPTAGSGAPTVAPTAPPPPTSSPLKTIGLVVGGVGIAAGAAGVVTGLMSRSQKSDLDRDCLGRTQPDCTERADRLNGLATLTTGLWIGGGVLVAAGLGMYLLAPSSAPAKSAGETSAGPTVSVGFAPGAGGGHVVLSGSF